MTLRGGTIGAGLVAGALATLAAAWIGGAQAGSAADLKAQGQPTGCVSHGTKLIEHGPRTKRVVAVTFDDGPSEFTPAILKRLNAAGVKATFFPVAQEIEGREKLLRRTFAGGMEVENHTFTHADLGNGGPAATDEMRRANERIRAVLGFTPCIFRPPYASVGNDLVARARRLGMSTVGRDVDPSDWLEPGKDAIVSRVLDATRPGSIINLHDGGGNRSQTVAALPTILRELKDRGYRMTTVSKLLGYRPIFAR